MCLLSVTYSGDRDTYQTLPRWLQEGNVTVYTNTDCKKTWGSSINPGHVCVGDIDNRRGAGSCNVRDVPVNWCEVVPALGIPKPIQ